MGTRATAARASSARPHQMAGIVEGMGICAGCAVVGFGEQAGWPDHRFTLESHFCAGDVAAPACSPKPPRCTGQDRAVLRSALAVQRFDDGRGDIEQGFEEVDHGNL